MIQILRIPVPKDRLQALSKDERVLLLLLGYVSNQILMMEKLLTFASRKDPTDDAEQKMTGVQTQMLLRLMIGILNEAWEVIQTRFSKTRLNLEYRPLLDAEGVRSLDEINRQFGSSNLLNRIRTNYAFHQPHSDDVESAFHTAMSNPHLDADWNFYFAQHAYNSMYFISDIVIVHGIFKELGESDWTAGQTKIMSEVTSAANSIKGFAAAFTKAVWQKNFGQEMQCDKVIEIHDAPKAEEFSLPFFVEMSGEEPFRANPAFR